MKDQQLASLRGMCLTSRAGPSLLQLKKTFQIWGGGLLLVNLEVLMGLF